MIRQLRLLILCLLISTSVFSKDETISKELLLPGIEGIYDFSINRDGLEMVVAIKQKSGQPDFFLFKRSAVTEQWSSKTPFKFLPDNEISENLRVRNFFFSYDDSRLYFAAKLSSSKGGYDIYYLERTSDGWSEPIQMDASVNTTESESSPSLSANGREFYFVRLTEMKKLSKYYTGVLYHQTMDRNDNWQTPVMITEQVNRGGLRDVKIYPDGKALMYSNVTDSKNGWELRWTSRLGQKDWILPIPFENIDDKHYEVSPFYCAADGLVYYISMKEGAAIKSFQLFTFPIPEKLKPKKTIWLKGKMSNKLSKSALKNASVLVTDENSNYVKSHLLTNESGEWETCLLANQSYMIHYSVDGFTQEYQLISDAETNEDLNFETELLPKVSVYVNTYDVEDYKPLATSIKVTDEQGKQIAIAPKQTIDGQQKFQLDVGQHYFLIAQRKDYLSDTIDLALQNAVIFDTFEKDIEMQCKRSDVLVQLYDQDTDSILSGEIVFQEHRRRRLLEPESKTTEGNYVMNLRRGETYNVEISGVKGYTFYSHVLAMDSIPEGYVYRVPFIKMTKDTAIELDNILFENNSADLMKSSFPELDRVVKLLEDNPEVCLEIGAHTDDVGSNLYNVRLSQRRAQSVVRYLEENNINYSRLVPKGYGEAKPLVENNSDENRSLNRRVEMRLADAQDIADVE